MHVVAVGCAEFRSMLERLTANPVLIGEVVLPVEEGGLLLLGVGTAEVIGFGLVVADRVGLRVVEGVVVAGQVLVVEGQVRLLRLRSVRELVP